MHGAVNHPAEGEVVNVLFDAKSQKVKLSDEYKLDQHKQGKDKADSFRTIADAPPDSPVRPRPARGASGEFLRSRARAPRPRSPASIGRRDTPAEVDLEVLVGGRRRRHRRAGTIGVRKRSVVDRYRTPATG
ncbi:MAG: hypothetical protein ACLP0J_11740 [Solirubrobacteraceae bacterium]